MTRRFFQGCALAALVGVLLSFALPSVAEGASPPQGAIKGGVFLPPATPGTPPEPVAGAVVKLFRPNGTHVATKVTNAAGKFAFGPIPPGPYVLKAFKPDVGQGHRGVVVGSGQISIAPIKLVQ